MSFHKKAFSGIIVFINNTSITYFGLLRDYHWNSDNKIWTVSNTISIILINTTNYLLLLSFYTESLNYYQDI